MNVLQALVIIFGLLCITVIAVMQIQQKQEENELAEKVFAYYTQGDKHWSINGSAESVEKVIGAIKENDYLTYEELDRAFDIMTGNGEIINIGDKDDD